MKEKGITLIALVITIVVLLILVGIMIDAGDNIIKSANLQAAITNMLMIQTKVRILSDEANFEGKDSILVGTKLSTIVSGSQNAMINSLKQNGVFTEPEKENLYLLDGSHLIQMGLENIKLKSDEYYIVNYQTDEVIYTKGIEDKNGTIYYKLSELANVGL